MKTQVAPEADGSYFGGHPFTILGCLLAFFLAYMLSLGPAARVALRNRAPSMGTPRWFDITYKPAEIILFSMPGPIGTAYGNYLKWCITFKLEQERSTQASRRQFGAASSQQTPRQERRQPNMWRHSAAPAGAGYVLGELVRGLRGLAPG